MVKVDPMVAGYLQDRKILVIDPSSAFSQMIRAVMVEMGVRGVDLKVAKDVSAALKFMEDEPQVIICEYSFANVSGFTFSAALRELYPNQRDRIFLLVTSSGQQNAIVDAAEEQADGFLLKPFSPDQLRKVLVKIIEAKMNPTEYDIALERMQSLMRENQLDEAEKAGLDAVNLTSEPTLAHSYLAEVYQRMGDFEMAEIHCDHGLSYKPAHYRCLKLKLQVLEESGNNKGALEVLNYFVTAYPTGNDILIKAFSLSVESKNFDFVGDYYAKFRQRDEHSPELLKAATRALYCAGLFMLSKNKNKAANEFFSDCVLCSGRDVTFIEKIIHALLKTRRTEDADAIYNMYPTDLVGTVRHQEMDFLITCSTQSPAHIIEKGRQIITAGAASPEVYAEVIRRTIELGREVAAENLAYEAVRRYPDEKKRFYEIVGLPTG